LSASARHRNRSCKNRVHLIPISSHSPSLLFPGKKSTRKSPHPPRRHPTPPHPTPRPLFFLESEVQCTVREHLKRDSGAATRCTSTCSDLCVLMPCCGGRAAATDLPHKSSPACSLHGGGGRRRLRKASLLERSSTPFRY
jgi:hypothetical protein